jgi:predicted small metal-binding protein
MKLIAMKKDGKKFKAACPSCGFRVEQFNEDTVKRLMGQHMKQVENVDKVEWTGP